MNIDILRNKKILQAIAITIIALAVTILIFSVYRARHDQKSPEAKIINVPTRPLSELAAKQFMLTLENKDDYESEPLSVESYPEFWNVWFATKDKDKRPNRGLVQINKTTGKAEWKFLQ